MADIKYYDVILKPVITEKSMNGMARKEYTFLVHPEANKSQIREGTNSPPTSSGPPPPPTPRAARGAPWSRAAARAVCWADT